MHHASLFVDYEFLGCWRGEAKRHIGLASDKNELVFGPVFKKSAIALAEAAICKSAAAERGIQMFIVTKHGCRGDAHTGLKFQKYGRSDSCKRSEHDANIGHAYARGGIFSLDRLTDLTIRALLSFPHRNRDNDSFYF